MGHICEPGTEKKKYRYDEVSSYTMKTRVHRETGCTSIWVCVHIGEGPLDGDIAYCYTCGVRIA